MHAKECAERNDDDDLYFKLALKCELMRSHLSEREYTYIVDPAFVFFGHCDLFQL